MISVDVEFFCDICQTGHHAPGAFDRTRFLNRALAAKHTAAIVSARGLTELGGWEIVQAATDANRDFPEEVFICSGCARAFGTREARLDAHRRALEQACAHAERQESQ